MNTMHIYAALILTTTGYHAVIPELMSPISLGHLFTEAKSSCGDEISKALNTVQISVKKNPIIVVQTAALNYLRDNGVPRDHLIDIIEVTINA